MKRFINLLSKRIARMYVIWIYVEVTKTYNKFTNYYFFQKAGNRLIEGIVGELAPDKTTMI